MFVFCCKGKILLTLFGHHIFPSRDWKKFQSLVGPSLKKLILDCSPSNFKVLEHLHLKAAKLIHKLSSKTPDSDVLDLVKWKPLGYIYKRRLASIMYQVFHYSLPDQLTAPFETRNTDNSYNLRHINDFSYVQYNCNLGRNSVIRYRGPIVWNLILKAIRDASSQQLFKQKLRQASRILDQIQFEKEACQITSKQTGFLYF